MQPKNPLFTSGSQHPPRFGHAVYLGVDENNFSNPTYKWILVLEQHRVHPFTIHLVLVAMQHAVCKALLVDKNNFM